MADQRLLIDRATIANPPLGEHTSLKLDDLAPAMHAAAELGLDWEITCQYGFPQIGGRDGKLHREWRLTIWQPVDQGEMRDALTRLEERRAARAAESDRIWGRTDNIDYCNHSGCYDGNGHYEGCQLDPDGELATGLGGI